MTLLRFRRAGKPKRVVTTPTPIVPAWNQDPDRLRGPAVDAAADVLRDWIHGTPMSWCGPGADTCPDWPQAYDLARLVVGALDDRGYLTDRSLLGPRNPQRSRT